MQFYQTALGKLLRYEISKMLGLQFKEINLLCDLL